MGVWLRRPEPAPDAAARLVCLPHAGGSAVSYQPLVQGLRPVIDAAVIQYPGRHDRFAEPAYSDIDILARDVADVLRREMTAPLALFGHSMGALVAYEVAIRLADAGVEVSTLIVSAAAGPATPRPTRRAPASDAELVAELRAMGGTDEALLRDPAALEMILPPLRNDLAALERYRRRDRPRLTIPITALVGAADPYATAADARGWEACTTGPFDVQILAGGHFYLFGQELRLAATVTNCIRLASAPGFTAEHR